MHAERLCHKWLTDVFPQMHERRREAVSAVVCAAVRGSRLTVTALGRSIESSVNQKHNIKRSDRLLSSSRLGEESFEIYSSITNQIIKTPRPLILIDWAHIDEGKKFYLLRAATPVDGRSLTLYEEVHTVKTKEKPKTHKQFLDNLKKVLPLNCKPIIVTDAGFRVPWFKQVLLQGWDYVGRVRNREMVFLEDTWIPGKSLYLEASSKPALFKSAQLSRSNPLNCSLVLYKGKSKKRKCLTRTGKIARSRRSLVSAARAREPWLLATSLSTNTPDQIVKIYRTRMQVEEAFRDLKNSRAGMALEFSGTYLLNRMKNLVLIGTLAAIVSWLLGTTTKLLKLHHQFQANSIKYKPILSAHFLGVQTIRNSALLSKIKCFKNSIATIHKQLLCYA